MPQQDGTWAMKSRQEILKRINAKSKQMLKDKVMAKETVNLVVQVNSFERTTDLTDEVVVPFLQVAEDILAVWEGKRKVQLAQLVVKDGDV